MEPSPHKPKENTEKTEKEQNTPSASYVLTRQGVTIGYFASFYAAYQYGLNNYLQNNFFVRKVGEQ